ncbi:MAG: hypothetical protein LBI30_03185 [Holosporales bacterium]|nr:hypothetical protein [Holosporales bacterium]
MSFCDIHKKKTISEALTERGEFRSIQPIRRNELIVEGNTDLSILMCIEAL